MAQIKQIGHDEASEKALEELLSGNAKPDGDMQAYLVGVLKNVDDERGKLTQRLKQAQQQVNMCQTRLVELQGIGGKALADLRAALAKKKKEEPKAAAK